MTKCVSCQNCDDDLRFGVCFDCASAAEERASQRTVLQHCLKGARNTISGKWSNARIDFAWAWERLTRTGDYAAGGAFDCEGYNWRQP